MTPASSDWPNDPDWPPQRLVDPLLHTSQGLPAGVWPGVFGLDWCEPVDLP